MKEYQKDSSLLLLSLTRTNKFCTIGIRDNNKNNQDDNNINGKTNNNNNKCSSDAQQRRNRIDNDAIVQPVISSSCPNPSQQRTTINLFLDIDEPYTRDVIIKLLQHPNRRSYFHVTIGPGHGMDAIPIPEHCNFQWSEYERIDWDAVQNGKHTASSYMIRKGISRKAQLAYYTKLYCSKNPTSILLRAIPPTIIIDTWSVFDDTPTTTSGTSTAGDLADIITSIGGGNDTSDNMNQRYRLDKCLARAKDLLDEAERKYNNTIQASSSSDIDPPVWILKGSTVNKGVGIYIIHFYEQIVDYCWTDSDIREWVVQRYIDRPLLLRKRKFHIRAYVLAVSAIQVYLFRDCLTLCSGSKYNLNNTTNLFSHITNTAYQTADRNFQEDKCVLLWNQHDIAPILVKDRTCQDYNDASDRINKVWDDMVAITGELFAAYQTELGVFSPIDGCFEHYGLDFIVDETWQVYLLEVNPGPDFKQTGSRLQSVIERLMDSTINIVFHPQLNIPCDTTNMELCYEYDYTARNRR